MQIDNDDIYDVFLISLRLASWHNLKLERYILADSLLRSGLPKEVLEVWQQPHVANLNEAIQEMEQNLATYAPMIQSMPEIFDKSLAGKCCARILAQRAAQLQNETVASLVKMA